MNCTGDKQTRTFLLLTASETKQNKTECCTRYFKSSTVGCLISLVHTKQKLEQLEAVQFLTLSRVYHLATVMFPATFKSTNEMKNCDFIHSSLEWILAGHYRLLWSTSDSQVNCLLFYSILSRMNKHPSCLHSLHKKPEQKLVVCVCLFTSFML